MPKIKVNDINMHYEIHGEGWPLVLVSGFSADHLGWTPVLDALSKKYQVILFNNRGAGQTDVQWCLFYRTKRVCARGDRVFKLIVTH